MKPTKIDDFEKQRSRLSDDLRGRALSTHEVRAERLVAPNDLSEAPLQRRDVEVSGEARRRTDVVGGPGAFELVEEPQSLLREGQRQPVGAFDRPEGRR